MLSVAQYACNACTYTNKIAIPMHMYVHVCDHDRHWFSRFLCDLEALRAP